MCTISANMAYGQTLPDDFWGDVEHFNAFKKLLDKAREFDKVTGQPNCEDPEKAKWWSAIEERHSQE